MQTYTIVELTVARPSSLFALCPIADHGQSRTVTGVSAAARTAPFGTARGGLLSWCPRGGLLSWCPPSRGVWGTGERAVWGTRLRFGLVPDTLVVLQHIAGDQSVALVQSCHHSLVQSCHHSI